MLKKLLIVLLVLTAIGAIIVARQPDDFRITRSATIGTPADRLFSEVNDFHKWDAWSPWAKLDPQVKNAFNGPESGVGAFFEWSGDSQVGQGNMTIVESRPAEYIKIRLEFIRPFSAVNTAEFTFKPVGDQTQITWSMFGTNNFVGKAIGLVMDCDKMVGDQFEKGLENLRKVASANPAA